MDQSFLWASGFFEVPNPKLFTVRRTQGPAFCFNIGDVPLQLTSISSQTISPLYCRYVGAINHPSSWLMAEAAGDEGKTYWFARQNVVSESQGYFSGSELHKVDPLSKGVNTNILGAYFLGGVDPEKKIQRSYQPQSF